MNGFEFRCAALLVFRKCHDRAGPNEFAAAERVESETLGKGTSPLAYLVKCFLLRVSSNLVRG
jgi:hypothetical protein